MGPAALRGTYRDQTGGTQGVDPVLVPEGVQELAVQGRLEVGDVQGVVLLAVDAKVLDLVQGDGLVLGRPFIRRLVALTIRNGPSLVFKRTFVFFNWRRKYYLDRDSNPRSLDLRTSALPPELCSPLMVVVLKVN